MPRPGADPLPPTAQQAAAIESGRKHFRQTDRGTLVGACGSGKTLMSIKIAESFEPPCRQVLVAVPTTHLLKQAIEDWNRNFDPDRELEFVVVGSDATVTEGLEIEGAGDVLVTTDPETLAARLDDTPDFRTTRVVVSTYDSTPVVAEAQAGARKERQFDLLVADEAHRTAGGGGAYQTVLHNRKIRAARRLFQTATPRMQPPEDAAGAGTLAYDYGLGEKAYSMDDESVYGRIFYEFTLRQAIAEPDLPVADYRIVPHGVRRSDLEFLVGENGPEAYRALYAACHREELPPTDAATALAEELAIDLARVEGTGKYGRITKEDVERFDAHGPEALDRDVRHEEALEGAAAAYALCDLLDTDFRAPDRGAKVVSYHDTKRRAAAFRDAMDTLDAHRDPADPPLVADYLDGDMSIDERSRRLGRFSATADTDHALLCNCRALNEGVNIDRANTVAFSDPRGSPIEVMQAIGRVIREDAEEPDKVATVVVPLVVDDVTDPAEPALTPFSAKRLRRALLAGKMIDADVVSRIDRPARTAATPEGRVYGPADLPPPLRARAGELDAAAQRTARKMYESRAPKVDQAVAGALEGIVEELRAARGRAYWGVQWDPKRRAWWARPRNPWYGRDADNPDPERWGTESVVDLGHHPTAEAAAEAVDAFTREAERPWITNFGNNPHRPDEMDVDNVTPRFPGKVSKAPSRSKAQRWRGYIDLYAPPPHPPRPGVDLEASEVGDFTIPKKPTKYYATETEAAHAHDAFCVRYGHPERRIFPDQPVRWGLIRQSPKLVEEGIEEETMLEHDPTRNFWVYVTDDEDRVVTTGYAASLEEARALREELRTAWQAERAEGEGRAADRTGYPERVTSLFDEAAARREADSEAHAWQETRAHHTEDVVEGRCACGATAVWHAGEKPPACPGRSAERADAPETAAERMARTR